MAESPVNKPTGLEIAVTGMAGRFPGAPDIRSFWDNLTAGRHAITFFSDEELQAAGVEAQLLKDPRYVKAMPVLADKDYFDAPFFGYSPAEAEVLSPQARLFLQSSWAALEDAGYDPLAFDGPIGCYVGASSSFSWQLFTILSGKNRNLGAWASHLLSEKDSLATLLAYKLDLKGPGLTFFSACSTSLVAVHLGCRSLLTGECRLALVGGIALDTQGKPGYLYQEGMILSPDGLCRAFDAQANGTIFGEGVGVAVLKRLPEALADGDHIYAVIKGSAANNDGQGKVGYTAPGTRGERDVIMMAQKLARIPAESISYLEAHGTGTSLGDPIEIAASTEAFHTGKKQFCAIGSVKTNIGHLDTAAGIAGFIKTVLCLVNRQIPASLHFQTPNPAIDFANSPFYVNTVLTDWGAGPYPRRAGVSAFGIGGANAHVILEEAPEIGPSNTPPVDGYRLVVLSAKSETALEKMTANLADYLRENPQAEFPDIAYTLQTGRRAFPFRRFAVCSRTGDIVSLFSSPGHEKVKTFALTEENPDRPLVFMFPGLGSEYTGMGRDLYDKEPRFAQELDRCFAAVGPLLGISLKEILYPPLSPASAQPLDQVEIAQVSLFIIEYALARLLMLWGLNPAAMIGYSFGEYAAACVAGVFSLEDALALVVTRGRLIQGLKPGAMLSVPVERTALTALLAENSDLELFLAIDNGPSCIVTGQPENVAAFEKRLQQKRILCLTVPVSRPLHSPLMRPIIEDFETKVKSLNRHGPQVPYISNVTGDWVKPGQAVNPHSWSAHLQQPVLFADGLKKIIAKRPNALFVEVGPGRDLSALVGRYLQEGAREQVIHLVRHPQRQVSDHYFLLSQVGRLWLYGRTPDWRNFYTGEKRHRLSLPSYPFDRHYYPASGDPFDYGKKLTGLPDSLDKKPDIADWFYVPSFKRTVSPRLKAARGKGTWLLWLDRCGLGANLARRLAADGHRVVTVKPGEAFAKTGANDYTLDPGKEEDYRALFSQLAAEAISPSRIVHCWGLTGGGERELSRETFDKAQYYGLYSLVFLARAMSGLSGGSDIELTAVLDQVLEVTGRESLAPEKSTILAALKVIAQEYPYIRCRALDICLPKPGSSQEKRLFGQLLAELAQPVKDPVIAWRDGFRWLQTFEPVRLAGIPEGQPIPRLRTGGVYLITGGLGGLGLTLAGYLAENFRAKLILTARSPLPDRQEWPDWDKKPGADPGIGRKIAAVKALEEMGAEVLAVTADVADAQEMAAILSRAEERFGPLNGVIHAAGILGSGRGFGVLARVSQAEFLEQFQAKVYGLLTLSSLLANQPLDFCLLTSSLSPLLGGLGFIAYASANQFMDAFVARYNRGAAVPFTSLNWGDWQPWDGRPEQSHIGASINRLNMLPGEGIETFRRILFNDDFSQVIVSAGDLQVRIDQWVRLETVRQEMPKKGQKPTANRRSHLSSAYVAAGNEIEMNLAQIWQQLFGYDQIGIKDDFFELGGDSLKAITMLSRIHQELSADISLNELFRCTTIEQLAQHIGQPKRPSPGTIYPVPEPAPAAEHYLLSAAQKRLFILQHIARDFVGYNEHFTFLFAGNLDKGKLEQAFCRVIGRHESLRTAFVMVGQGPRQKILDPGAVPFPLENRILDAEKAAPLALERLIQAFIQPFDLSSPPLVRAVLFSLPGNNHLLFIDMHHIVFDGTSMGLLIEEVTRLYSGEELPPLPIQYKDYSVWQEKLFATGYLKAQQAYWLSQFADATDIPRLNLVADFSRPALMTFAGDSYDFKLEAAAGKTFKALAQAHESTLYMNLLAALQVLIFKITGQEDIAIGSGILGRPLAEFRPLIGMFVNTLVMRGRPQGHKRFCDFLDEIKTTCLHAYDNQDFPFEDLVEQLSPERDPSRNPLFDICFAFQNFEQPAPQINGLSLKPYSTATRTSRFDLTVFAWELGDEIMFHFEYYAAIFKPETMARLAGHLVRVIEEIGKDPESLLSDIDLLSAAEKRRLLVDFNDTAAAHPLEKTIQQLFSEQVAKTPDRIAIVGANGNSPLQCSVSYKELDRNASALAGELIEKGVCPNTIVGIKMGRSIEMIIGIMGILKAGGAYLPLDPDFPQERIDYMLADSGAEIVIGPQTVGANCCSPIQDIGAECKGERQFAPTDLAYVIYTSGSTGRPKGVLTTHSNVIRVVKNANYIDISEKDRLLQLSNYAFDGSVFDIYGALLNGAALVMVDRQQLLSVDRLQALIKREQVTVFFVTTALFNTLVDIALQGLSQVRRVLFGGERVSVEHVKKALDVLGKDRVIHVYGPTETTVYACFYPVNKVAATAYTVPIGRPLTDTTVYILDKYLHLVPIGVAGELYIGGAGLARGYLNNPELTAEKFITSPLTNRLYRTGDLGRWLEDGNIEFLGRVDAQVKIRGFRIEPGEIEACLIQHPAVSEAVVTVIEERGDRALCAYLVTEKPGANTGPPDAQLREFLARHLPDYMVPAYFVLLDAFPLNPSGKIDRKKLPGPQIDTGPTFVPPGDELEEALAQIWAEVLLIDRDKISIDADFFRLGGHSLKAATLVSRIRVQFNIEISLIEVFKNPTIRGLATLIRAIQWVSHAGAAPAEEEEELTL